MPASSRCSSAPARCRSRRCGNRRHWRELPFWLVAASAGLYAAGVIALTRQLNLPLNAYTES